MLITKILLYSTGMIFPFLLSGINPAIVLSKLIYHKDICSCGSGNPGFTNFKRTFGNKWAWWVLVFDLLKGALSVVVFACLFEWKLGEWQFGAAYAGLFAMLGHAYPVYYKFKGGKGFLVYMSVVWFIDWRAGLIAVAIMLLLLFTTKYMSLATNLAMLSCPITLLICKASPWVIGLCTVSVLFMLWRHRENIKRLFKGTESKTYLFGKKSKKKEEEK